MRRLHSRAHLTPTSRQTPWTPRSPREICTLGPRDESVPMLTETRRTNPFISKKLPGSTHTSPRKAGRSSAGIASGNCMTVNLRAIDPERKDVGNTSTGSSGKFSTGRNVRGETVAVSRLSSLIAGFYNSSTGLSLLARHLETSRSPHSPRAPTIP